MIEDIKLDKFPKESGAYLFKVDDEVIYVGSSNNLYKRMINHRCCIRKGGDHNRTSKQDLYQFLQKNHFTVEFKITDNYRQLEQQLVEQYNPKYNAIRAYTGLGARKGRVAEYEKERYQKYKEEILEQLKQYYVSHKQQKKQYYELNKEELKQYQNQYDNQLCCYNDEILKLCALSARFRKAGIMHPTAEAKKYLLGGCYD